MFPVAEFINRSIMVGTSLVLGSTGEILTEKSGNLNLGIPGIMCTGAISGLVGGFLYINSGAKFSSAAAIAITLAACCLGSLLVTLIYSFLTITLRVNQNVTGLALTTFGVGLANFFGGSLKQLSGADSISVVKIAKVYKKSLPFADKLGDFGKIFFSYGFIVYLAIIIVIIVSVVLKKTRVGLHLCAVGENPATADAAGINVTRYKYLATCIGGMISGLGGFYYFIDYMNGSWEDATKISQCGWLSIALVIFAIWRPVLSMFGSYVFGGLWILYNYTGFSVQIEPIINMLPYVVTIIVLITVSLRRKRETQPPASLGLNYFREDR